jgi:hypothetical protein
VAAKPSGKITTKQKPSGVFTGRDNAKFTAMSALGQKQTSHQAGGMSALPPIADIAGLQLDVR